MLIAVKAVDAARLCPTGAVWADFKKAEVEHLDNCAHNLRILIIFSQVLYALPGDFRLLLERYFLYPDAKRVESEIASCVYVQLYPAPVVLCKGVGNLHNASFAQAIHPVNLVVPQNNPDCACLVCHEERCNFAFPAIDIEVSCLIDLPYPAGCLNI